MTDLVADLEGYRRDQAHRRISEQLARLTGAHGATGQLVRHTWRVDMIRLGYTEEPHDMHGCMLALMALEIAARTHRLDRFTDVNTGWRDLAPQPRRSG